MRFYLYFLCVALLCAGALSLSSCTSTKQIAYFQDIRSGENQLQTAAASEIRIRPKDKISIMINSKDPLLADLFNLPIVSRQIGNSGFNASQGLSGYTVNSEGKIDFPVVGEIHVAGRTREEIASLIKDRLIMDNLIKDPIVTVEYLNLTVAVLGEVSKPGRYALDKDNVTLLDALGLAGDLTIYGKRENIRVLREENGMQQVYVVDLCSANQLYASPAFYLRQNDVVYVEPNNTRANQSTVNGNNVRSTSFWISLTSLLVTITVLFVK